VQIRRESGAKEGAFGSEHVGVVSEVQTRVQPPRRVSLFPHIVLACMCVMSVSGATVIIDK
jgi:hypothetical protein